MKFSPTKDRQETLERMIWRAKVHLFIFIIGIAFGIIAHFVIKF